MTDDISAERLDQLFEKYRQVDEDAGDYVYPADAATVILNDDPAGLFLANRLVDLQGTPDAVLALCKLLRQLFAHQPRRIWVLAKDEEPLAGDDDLPAWLEDHGATVLLRDDGQPAADPANAWVVRPIAGEEELAHYCHTMWRAFYDDQLPSDAELAAFHRQMQLVAARGFRFFLALDGPEPVGTACLEPGPWSEISQIGVLPSHRRQGICRALLQHLRAVAAQEQRTLYLEAELAGDAYGIYARLGFTREILRYRLLSFQTGEA